MKKMADIRRLGMGFFVVVALLTFILTLSFSMGTVKASNPKTVYVVICVDSEMWGGHVPYLGSSNPHPTMDMRAYARSPPSTVSQVFDSSFRNSHQDSVGKIFKVTWFAEMDYLMAQSNFVYADGSPAGVSGYTAIHEILMNNWGTEIQTYGDSIEYHHHFMIYDGTWEQYNNGPDAGYPDYQMYALDHMIIDRNFYPSVWRSGWLIMPPALSNWLEQWIPFDYTPDSGIWSPVHPSGMNRWQTRSSYLPSQDEVNEAFKRARDYGSAIYSIYCHDRENPQDILNSLQTCLTKADMDESTYPNVRFKYCTAREAMQLALGFTDLTPPTFTVTASGSIYTITSNEPLWKNHPYVAFKYADGTYTHKEAIPTGTNKWTVTLPAGELPETIGVAASDLYGNPGVLVMPARHYLTLATSPQGVATPTGEGWYAVHDSASISTNEYVYTAADTRYRFNGWTTDDMTEITNSAAASTTVLMDKDKTVTANYVLQHRLTFNQTGLSASAIGTVVTVGGSAKAYGDLPLSIWVNNGTSVSYSYEAAVSSSTSGKRYRLDTVSGQQSPIIVKSPANFTGNYVTQYYLTVTSPYDTPGGQGWYDAGSTAYATLETGNVSGGTGIQHIFTGWSGDASGTDLKNNAITMNDSKTAVANWKTQYYLTMISAHDSPTPASGWYDAGTSVTASVTSPADESSGTGYRCTGWTGTGSVPASGTDTKVTFSINGPSSLTWNWNTQYYITVTSAHDSSTSSAWVDAGSDFAASVTSPTETVPKDHQWVCTGFSVDGGAYQTGTKYTFSSVQAAHTIDFAWKKQFWIQVNSFYGSPTTSQWIDQDGNLTVQVTSPTDDEEIGIRYKCTGYALDSNPPITDGSTSYTFENIGNAHVITFNWITQYRLTISTNFGSVSPLSNWYDAGTHIDILATPPNAKSNERYAWKGWTGTGTGAYTGKDNPATITINGPITETASWKLETQYPTEIFILIPAIIILGGLASAIILLKRRKKSA